jgi:signal transduction histidine kinase
MLQYVGLAATLKSRCREWELQHEIPVTFRADDDLGAIPSGVALCLYRVTQEALGNIVKHAGARHVQVALAREGKALALTIEDDGRGFELAEVRGGGGLGLISLDERVRLVGGELAIDTSPQVGTRLRIVVPSSEADHGSPDRPAR